MKVQPYLFFDGRCEEALNFYRTAVGARMGDLMRYKDNPEPPSASSDGCGPGGGAANAEKIMHASFHIGETELMASDGYAAGKPEFKGVSLALSPATVEEAERLFKGLCDGGQVQMPLGKTFYSPSFGMVVDRFGVSWMVVASPDAA